MFQRNISRPSSESALFTISCHAGFLLDLFFDVKVANRSLKCGRVQIFGNGSKKSKFDSGGNEGEIE
jgi:hypothetical protein